MSITILVIFLMVLYAIVESVMDVVKKTFERFPQVCEKLPDIGKKNIVHVINVSCIRSLK